MHSKVGLGPITGAHRIYDLHQRVNNSSPTSWLNYWCLKEYRDVQQKQRLEKGGGGSVWRKPGKRPDSKWVKTRRCSQTNPPVVWFHVPLADSYIWTWKCIALRQLLFDSEEAVAMAQWNDSSFLLLSVDRAVTGLMIRSLQFQTVKWEIHRIPPPPLPPLYSSQVLKGIFADAVLKWDVVSIA